MDRRKGILAVAGGCMAITWPGALVFGYPGVMSNYWQQAFGVGRGALGSILFVMLAAVGTFMFLVGRWQTSLGLRRMAFLGIAFTAGSLLWLAWAPGLLAVYVWAFVAGASSCLVYLPALTVAQLWWPKHKGLASGAVAMAFAASAALLSPFFAWFLDTLGYTMTNLLLAGATLVLGGLATRFFVLPDAGGSATPEQSDSVLPSVSPRQALRTRAFWFLWSIWALQGAAGISMVTLYGAIGRTKGFSISEAVTLLVAFNLASGASRLAMGVLSDRIDRTISMSAVFAAAGLAYLGLPQVQGLAVSWLLTAAVGFSFGTLFSVSAPLVMECFGPKHFGPIFGLVFTAYGFVSGIIGPCLSGYFVDASAGSPAGACVYLGLFCLASSGLVLRVRPALDRPSWDEGAISCAGCRPDG